MREPFFFCCLLFEISRMFHLCCIVFFFSFSMAIPERMHPSQYDCVYYSDRRCENLIGNSVDLWLYDDTPALTNISFSLNSSFAVTNFVQKHKPVPRDEVCFYACIEYSGEDTFVNYVIQHGDQQYYSTDPDCQFEVNDLFCLASLSNFWSIIWSYANSSYWFRPEITRNRCTFLAGTARQKLLPHNPVMIGEKDMYYFCH